MQGLRIGDTVVMRDLLTTLSLCNFLANSDIMRLARDSSANRPSAGEGRPVSCVVTGRLGPRTGTTSPRYSVVSDSGSVMTVSEIELSIAGAELVPQD